jgi:hypothetical protein
MYTLKNYKTKKELKEAIALGIKPMYYQPGPFSGNEPMNGTITLEGPHYPEPHRWYTQAGVKDGYIISVK